MAGLVPAIHVFLASGDENFLASGDENVDARDEPGHDDEVG
ncbi:hypothetical protein [Bradyrhizobium uaiense]|nr:hypothetical protein [Bradyrhizobium uaiense]